MADTETRVRSYRQPCGACLECDVRSMAVCAALDDGEVGALERIMTPRTLEHDQTLAEEGDPRSHVYTLTSGMLRLSSALPDGRRQITGFLMPGDYFGLAGDRVHTQTAEAVAGCNLCAFPVREMDKLLASYPRLKDRLFVMTQLALRQAQDSQMILGRLTPLEKLAAFLLVFSRRAAAHKQKENPVLLPMSRADIADFLGLTVETVSRSFSELKKRGVIALPDAHTADIKDRVTLARLARIEPH
jgi:CRP/FNR family transcriptional regulator, anaerobic regulatory protein